MCQRRCLFCVERELAIEFRGYKSHCTRARHSAAADPYRDRMSETGMIEKKNNWPVEPQLMCALAVENSIRESTFLYYTGGYVQP